MNFKDRLRKIRIESGLTQKEVAELLNISVSCYAEYEQGHKEPDLITFVKICRLLCVSADYLLGRKNEDGTKNY